MRDRADGRVVGTFLEADLATGRVAERHACAEVEVVATLLTARRPLGHLVTQRAPQPYASRRRVRYLDGIVEEELNAVPLDEADRCVESPDETADRVVELAEHAHQLLPLAGVDEGPPAAQVDEDHRDLPPMAAQDRLVARRDDRFCQLGREEP